MRYITEQYGLSDYALDEGVSYVECNDPTQETYLTRERNEDAYVSTLDAEQYEANEAAYASWLAAQDDDVERTTYVEGVPMTVVSMERVYDKQNVVSNFYVDKDGFPRIGSVRFTTYNGTHIAQCVKCKASITYAGDYDRASMEDFTLAVYRHGHNHSAKWCVHTPIGEPVAEAIWHNDDTVANYNDVLFEQQVIDAVAPTYAVEQYQRRNGLR